MERCFTNPSQLSSLFINFMNTSLSGSANGVASPAWKTDPAARSVQVFGVYMVISGLTFMTVPNLLLPMIGLPTEQHVWIRVGGTLVMLLGWYYIMAANHDIRLFFRATAYGRIAVGVIFLTYYLLGIMPWQIALFAIPDCCGAVWTFAALRRSDPASS